MCIFRNVVLMMVRVVFVYQLFVDDVMVFIGVFFYTIVKHGGVFLNGNQSIVYMVTFVVAP